MTAFPPDLGARFRWFERWTPQPTFAAIVERVLATDPDFRAHHLGDGLRVVTREGEYAAWVPIEGRRQGAEAMRFIGAVFVEHFAGVLDCIAILPPHFEQLRQLSLELLRSAVFQFGARPRPFYYIPPAGWQALPGGASATWYPPDFPNNFSNIAIPHAVEIECSPESAIQTAFTDAAGGLTVESSSIEPISQPRGVTGSYLQLRGERAGRPGPLCLEMAMFVVDDRAYSMRLETALPESLPALRDVLRGVALSFKPLPRAEEARLGRAFASPTSDFDHWVI